MPALAYTPSGVPDVPGAKGDFRDHGRHFFKDNDIEAAKKLMAEAGYPDGKGFPAIEILYNTSNAHKAIAEAIQEMWKKSLGIDVTLTNQEWAVYLSNRTALKYQVARAGWIGDYVDAMTFMDMWVTGGGNNDTGWGNKAYDEVIEKAKIERRSQGPHQGHARRGDHPHERDADRARSTSTPGLTCSWIT